MNSTALSLISGVNHKNMSNSFLNKVAIDFKIYMLIILSCGILFKGDFVPSLVNILLWILLGASLFFKIKSFNLKNALIPLFVCFFFSLLFIVRAEDVVSNFKVLFSLLVAVLFVLAYQKEEIINSFIRVVSFLAIISIPLFIIYSLYPSFPSLFIIADSYGHIYKTWFTFAYIVGSNRNGSIFWEPGAFQTFINLALLFEISKSKQRFGFVAVLSIALITTFSTTGYIAYAMIMALFVVKKVFYEKGKHRLVIPLIIVLFTILLLFVFKDSIFTDDQNSVFGKIFTFFEYKEYTNTRGITTSASTRYFSLIKPLEEFVKSPIFGIGKDKLVEKTYPYLQGNLTCTFINWLAIYGIFYGGILIFGYFKLGYLLFNKKIILTILCFASIFVLTMSENYVTYAVFYVFPFLSYVRKTKENKYGKCCA